MNNKNTYLTFSEILDYLKSSSHRVSGLTKEFANLDQERLLPKLRAVCEILGPERAVGLHIIPA